MDYSKLSDNKINAEVALHWLGKGNFGLMNGAVETFGGSFNPCNNPEDAWPIITKSLIELVPNRSGEWRANSVCGEFRQPYQDKALRAAMIVFLMMQESE